MWWPVCALTYTLLVSHGLQAAAAGMAARSAAASSGGGSMFQSVGGKAASVAAQAMGLESKNNKVWKKVGNAVPPQFHAPRFCTHFTHPFLNKSSAIHSLCIMLPIMFWEPGLWGWSGGTVIMHSARLMLSVLELLQKEVGPLCFGESCCSARQMFCATLCFYFIHFLAVKKALELFARGWHDG